MTPKDGTILEVEMSDLFVVPRSQRSTALMMANWVLTQTQFNTAEYERCHFVANLLVSCLDMLCTQGVKPPYYRQSTG